MDSLIQYLGQRTEAGALIQSIDYGKALESLFGDTRASLPRPYKIFFVDENLPPKLGFPVKDSPLLLDLDSKLQSWIELEAAWQTTRDSSKKPVDQALSGYLTLLMKVAENAMLSNLLADYHAIFWLAHSAQMARHFTNLKKAVLSFDTNTGKNRIDAIRYRVFGRWTVDVREQMTQLTARMAPVLEGEEERGMQFFRMLNDNVLILTEEFISPDLRELRSYVTGYLNHNYFAFREKFERMRSIATSLIETDRVFRNSIELYAGRRLPEVSTGLLLDGRFQQFMFDHPALDRELTGDDRELVRAVSKKVGQFAVLHLLRRGIVWMKTDAAGEIVSTDERQEVRFSRTTRPIDYGHAGVVDPMVYRFGLMYDITDFSETLGSIAKAGTRGELSSYRQMLLFQRRLDGISLRHHLTLEKFLGDGAFYTTRRVIPLMRAAVEIQRCYDSLRSKGFAFDKGIRIALNFGYYRLLPMRFNPVSNERVMEFYGPGLVELSRLTTGKAMKEIEEIESFLIAHGYDLPRVQQFFAPLTRSARMESGTPNRRYQAYIDANNHLANEGIVASLPLVEELSAELMAEAHQLFRISAPWGNYIGFQSGLPGVDFIGMAFLGTVSLKGLEKVEIAEVVPFGRQEVEITPFEEAGVLLKLLRQEFHNRHQPEIRSNPQPIRRDVAPAVLPFHEPAKPQPPETPRPQPPRPETSTLIELVLFPKADSSVADEGILIGEWDPYTDEIQNSIRIPRRDLEGLLGFRGAITKERLEEHKKLLQQIYHRMRQSGSLPTVRLDSFRGQRGYLAFLLGERLRTEAQEK